MNGVLKFVLGLVLVAGVIAAEGAPLQAAERVIVVKSHQTRIVPLLAPRQRLGQPLVEPHGPILHLAYFPRTYRGAAYVGGSRLYRRTYVHTRRYAHKHVHVRKQVLVRKHVHVRRHAAAGRKVHVRKYRHIHRVVAVRAACPVVNRFGIAVAFAPGC